MSEPECFGCYEHCPIEIPDGLDENWEAMYWKIDCPKKWECYKHWSVVDRQPIFYLGDGNEKDSKI